MAQFTFNVTRDAVAHSVECKIGQVDFTNNGIQLSLHYLTALGELTNKSDKYESVELLQAATDAGEDGAAFLATFKAIIEQAVVTRHSN